MVLDYVFYYSYGINLTKLDVGVGNLFILEFEMDSAKWSPVIYPIKSRNIVGEKTFVYSQDSQEFCDQKLVYSEGIEIIKQI